MGSYRRRRRSSHLRWERQRRDVMGPPDQIIRLNDTPPAAAAPSAPAVNSRAAAGLLSMGREVKAGGSDHIWSESPRQTNSIRWQSRWLMGGQLLTSVPTSDINGRECGQPPPATATADLHTFQLGFRLCRNIFSDAQPNNLRLVLVNPKQNLKLTCIHLFN